MCIKQTVSGLFTVVRVFRLCPDAYDRLRAAWLSFFEQHSDIGAVFQALTPPIQQQFQPRSPQQSYQQPQQQVAEEPDTKHCVGVTVFRTVAQAEASDPLMAQWQSSSVVGISATPIARFMSWR
jgi:hypothetical protein